MKWPEHAEFSASSGMSEYSHDACMCMCRPGPMVCQLVAPLLLPVPHYRTPPGGRLSCPGG